FTHIAMSSSERLKGVVQAPGATQRRVDGRMIGKVFPVIIGGLLDLLDRTINVVDRLALVPLGQGVASGAL
ncbi:MAG TPA: hypothetical protein VF294_15295, partial [Polyangiaceae bacterium]